MSKGCTSLFSISGVLLLGFTSSGFASAPLAPPPIISSSDVTGVNLISSLKMTSLSDLAIGHGELSLKHTIASYGGYFDDFLDDYEGTYYRTEPNAAGEVGFANVTMGHQQFLRFKLDGTPKQENGAQQIKHDDGSISYVSNLGVDYLYRKIPANGEKAQHKLVSITHPTGFQIKIEHKAAKLDSGHYYYRKEKVTTNNGLQFSYQYKNNQLPNTAADIPFHKDPGNKTSDWKEPINIVALNLTSEYCAGLLEDCDIQGDWPEVTYSWPLHEDLFSKNTVFKVTDADGVATEFHQIGYNDGKLLPGLPRILGVKDNTSVNEVTAEYEYTYAIKNDDGSDKIRFATRKILKAEINGETWNYNYQYNTGGHGYYSGIHSSTGPEGTHEVWLLTNSGNPGKVKTPNGMTMELSDDFKNRLKYVTYLEGNSVHFEYDNRGNVIKRITKPKPDSGDTDLTEEANYDEVCSNIKTCNQPNWVKDAKGNKTEYTYHPESGKVASITYPANEVGVRPQTRFKYQQKYAYFKQSDGAEVSQADTPIWLLTEESYCQNGAAKSDGNCALDGDKVVKTYEYGAEGQANNLWLRGIAVSAGGEVQRTCYEYDLYGNQIGETKPKANLNSCQ